MTMAWTPVACGVGTRLAGVGDEAGEPVAGGLPGTGAALDSKRALPNPTLRSSSAMVARRAAVRDGMRFGYQPP